MTFEINKMEKEIADFKHHDCFEEVKGYVESKYILKKAVKEAYHKLLKCENYTLSDFEKELNLED